MNFIVLKPLLIITITVMPKPKRGRTAPEPNPPRSLTSSDVVHQSTAPPAPEPTNPLPAASYSQTRPFPENLSDETPSGLVDRVVIMHPGYQRNNDLITFYAWDNGTNGNGIHLGTVLLACGIIACNEFKGYISRNKDGSNRITEPDYYLLPTGLYYFYIGPGVSRYPVFPSFGEWTYPHDNVPKTWVGEWSRLTAPRSLGENVNSTTSLAVITRDTKCCISAFRDGIEGAHLCPQAEKDWFNANNMQSYNSTIGLSGKTFIDDRANSISLRSDIHGIFDAGSFVIVRKNNNWVAHFLKYTNNLGSLYHDQAAKIHEGVSPHFLLARFAWAIFRLTAGLYVTNEKRLVRLTIPGEEDSTKDYDIPGFSILERGEKAKSSNKKRKAEGEEDKTGGENDSGGPFDDEVALVATEALGSAKDIQLDSLTPVKITPIPRLFSKFDRHIAEMKRQALLKQRPNKPELLCCDYEAADQAADLGLPSNLCDECAGMEVLEYSSLRAVDCM